MMDYNGGTWGVGGDDAHAAMAAATRSNLVIYPIDPTGLSSGDNSKSALVLPGSAGGTPLEALMAFRGMAEITGGFELINSNSFDQTFERIVRDNSTYYMLGFDSAYEKADGRYVHVEIRTKRPGLTVHARDGYVAPTKKEKQQTAQKFASAPTPVATALASPLQTYGITLRVSAIATRGRGRDADVALTTDIDANTLGLVPKDGSYSGDLEMRYIATDANRRIFPEVRQAGKIRFEPRPGAEAASLSGIRVRVGTTLALPPGRYQIRVAAGTPLNAGNVVYDLTVPDFSDAPLAMSSLALLKHGETGVLALRASGSSRTGKPSSCGSSNCATPPSAVSATALIAEPSATGKSAIVELPTTARVFTPDAEILLTTEVYDNRKVKKGATPGKVTLTASLRNADGRLIQLATEQRSAAGGDGSGPLRFTLPLRLITVPPGSYALDVTSRSDTKDGPLATQSIPIRIDVPTRAPQ
jgi:hypothetical protein